MLSANIDVYEMSWDQLVEYFERLELSQSLETRERKNNASPPLSTTTNITIRRTKGKKRRA